ncbi:GNAT family N-acetyltransferase [Kitasatospora sp. McL0602]|uniref:GNAT family N-acetyltransferase n=1 Tax=Kitasatospora sp. McL0602 TaxID=3439530 RepID=UPI003F8BB496
MTWTLSSSLDEFDAEAGSFLAAHPAQNTVLLTLTHNLRQDGLHAYGEQLPVFGWWRAGPGKPVAGAFARTPPHPVRLGMMPPEAAGELARLLSGAGQELPGVGGGEHQARAFVDGWPGESSVQVEERLYRLGELVIPTPAPQGRARLATAADREVLIGWHEDFVAEAEVGAPMRDFGPQVDSRIAAGVLHVWEVDGRLVSFAGVSPVLAGMSRVGPVFTPKELRGHGYASALTAAGSAHAVAQGAAEVLLYTDLANPTSNSIYQKIGYRPVEDCLVVDFR